MHRIPRPRYYVNFVEFALAYFSLAVMAGIHEGQDYGIGDFILMDQVDIDSFLRNLKQRLVNLPYALVDRAAAYLIQNFSSMETKICIKNAGRLF